MSKRPLTARQQRALDQKITFVMEYLAGATATNAAIAAGYSRKSAHVQGSRLLSDAKVAALIREERTRRVQRLEINADLYMQRLAAICESDIKDAYDEGGNLLPIRQMPAMLRAGIAGVDTVIRNTKAGDGIVDTVVKIKRADPLRALELMFRVLGMLDRKEKKEDEAPLTDDQINARIWQLFETARARASVKQLPPVVTP